MTVSEFVPFYQIGWIMHLMIIIMHLNGFDAKSEAYDLVS